MGRQHRGRIEDEQPDAGTVQTIRCTPEEVAPHVRAGAVIERREGGRRLLDPEHVLLLGQTGQSLLRHPELEPMDAFDGGHLGRADLGGELLAPAHVDVGMELEVHLDPVGLRGVAGPRGHLPLLEARLDLAVRIPQGQIADVAPPGQLLQPVDGHGGDPGTAGDVGPQLQPAALQLGLLLLLRDAVELDQHMDFLASPRLELDGLLRQTLRDRRRDPRGRREASALELDLVGVVPGRQSGPGG
jgi:hypothetical protein